MKNKNQKIAFTFVELIVASTILIILASIGFYSYSKHINTSRDSKRKEAIINIKSDLEVYKKEKGAFPKPGDSFMLQNGSELVAFEGKINEKVFSQFPVDPLIKVPYLYSISRSKQEFQVATTLENNGKPISFLAGNYSSVSKYVLPSLLVAYEGVGVVDISNPLIQNKFILNNSSANLPYDFETKKPMSITGTLLSSLLDNPTTKLWQNTSYTSCEEICRAGKTLGEGTYQILNSSGTLIDTYCSFSSGCDMVEFTAGYDCTLEPIYPHIVLTKGSPTMHNQLWQNTNSSNPCYFTCENHYIWNNLTNTCDPANQTANCNGNIPTNASATTGTGFTQTWNGSSWIPSSITWGENKTDCDFDCNIGYTWNSGTSSCESNTQTASCTGLLINASWNTASSITQTWNGSAWSPTTTGVYNTTASTTSCRYKCDTGYSWNGSSCINNCTFGSGVFGICIF